MTEQELMEKIKSSAEEIEIPEGISPESMKKKLEAKKQKRGGKNRWRAGKNTAVAAAILLVCGVGVSATYRTMQGDSGASTADAGMDMAAGIASDMDMAEQESVLADSAEKAETAEVESAMAHEKSDAGNLYVVAENYGDIYDVLEQETRNYYDIDYESDMKWGAATSGVDEAADGAMLEDAVNFDSSGEVWDMESSDVSVVNAQTQEASVERGENYTKTNLQMAGVDESDIIKTDGSYIYVVSKNAVKIIDIQGKKMKETGEIDLSLNSAADRVVEMYVDDDKLNLIVERQETKLNQSGTEEDSSVKNTKDRVSSYDVYYMDSNMVTELQTYDISNRKEPVLKGSMTQDGAYETSRKIGKIVYLFTEKSMQMPSLSREQAIKGENAGGWIPLVNGTAIAADCVYIPEQGSNGLVISSVNVGKPDKVVDNTLIMNNYVNIYVSTEALYLYGQDYSGSGVVTQIAKFGLKEGLIDAVGATSAAGDVYDTFAINEYQGKLRLLTTDWSQDENDLYLFDENLKLTGSLKGIAKGEQIYAARYFGDTAYFVTYRNTDPLFAVDLSDEKNPKILSELKITGFSEYLHFWGKDKLVGIGYETDPDTGIQEGIKLTMFDISNPAKLRTLGTCVINNLSYSPALYDYKCVLADAEENVIGFAADSYNEKWECIYSYHLFAWENGKFEELMTESIPAGADTNKYRGLYVGDTFYLASPENITSYDREQGYKTLERLEL